MTCAGQDDGSSIVNGFVYSTADTTCVSFSSEGEWVESYNISEQRLDHNSWASPSGLVLMGGFFSPTSTEILSPYDSDTSNGFTLEYNAE